MTILQSKTQASEEMRFSELQGTELRVESRPSDSPDSKD